MSTTKQIEQKERYVNLYSKIERNIPQYFLMGEELEEYLNLEDWSYYWIKEFDDEGMIIDGKEDTGKLQEEWRKINKKIAKFYNIEDWDDVELEGYNDGDGDFQITYIYLHTPSHQ